MAGTYAGIYRAKCVSVNGATIRAEVPQIFGTVQITFGSTTGPMPKANDRGWVMFEGGQAQYPVWSSAYHPTPTPTSYDAPDGVILTSPNGTRYVVVVSNAGVLSTVLA